MYVIVSTSYVHFVTLTLLHSELVGFLFILFFLSLWLLLTICYLFLFFSIRAKPSCLYERNVYLCLLHAI